jgi:hypothetical protein
MTVLRLRRPGLDEARVAVEALYGANSLGVWGSLLRSADITGTETDAVSFDRLVAAMAGSSPVLALCAKSLRIRSATYEHLAAAYSAPQEAE